MNRSTLYCETRPKTISFWPSRSTSGIRFTWFLTILWAQSYSDFIGCMKCRLGDLNRLEFSISVRPRSDRQWSGRLAGRGNQRCICLIVHCRISSMADSYEDWV